MEEGHIAYSDTSIEGLENTKNYIRNLIISEKNYKKAMEELDALFQIDNKDLLWFYYYNKSLVYLKMDELKNTLKYANESLKYIVTCSDKINSLWMIATMNERMYKNDKRIIKKNKNIYLQLTKECKITFQKNRRILILAHITEIERNEKRMYKILKYLEKVNDIDDTYCAKDMTKEGLIETILNELLNICIEKNNINMINEIRKHYKNNKKYSDIILKKLKIYLLV